MKITLTGKQVDIGDRLRKHVEEAIENSVNKYFSVSHILPNKDTVLLNAYLIEGTKPYSLSLLVLIPNL